MWINASAMLLLKSADYRAYRDQAEAKQREQEKQIQQLRDQQIKNQQQQQQQITELQHKLRMATASSPVSVAAQEVRLIFAQFLPPFRQYTCIHYAFFSGSNFTVASEYACYRIYKHVISFGI